MSTLVVEPAKQTAPVKTLVFFDLETTSLPSAGQRVGITELAFVAVDREHFEKQDKPNFRVLNKLTLCIRPETYIHPVASEKSGMTNALLGNQCLFRDVVPSLRSFLATLPGPVCLLAHNGDYFDFPILRDELKHAGEGYLGLPDLLCCDTIKALRQIVHALPPPKKKGRGGGPHSLDVLYKRFCGRRSNAHQAEQDCVDLMKVCHHHRQPFLEYLGNNVVPFHTVEPVRR
ncbi:unnamed protein product [Ixodes hexagonus]